MKFCYHKCMNRLKEIAKKYNLKQEEIAKIIHKSRPTVSKYMTGQVSPDIETYIILADYFKISLDDLIGREGYPSISEQQKEAIENIKKQIEKL